MVIGPDTNARTDIPLTITVTADAEVPVTVSIAPPSDAQTLLDGSRHTRVTGVEVRDWAIRTTSVGSGEPITPATADLWRSQTTSNGTSTLVADLENAPETMIITTPTDTEIAGLAMTWANPAWFYQALSVAFGGLLALLVGSALIIRGPGERAEGGSASEGSAAAGDSVAPEGEVAR